jgi:hypothetical protein
MTTPAPQAARLNLSPFVQQSLDGVDAAMLVRCQGFFGRIAIVIGEGHRLHCSAR